MGNNKYDGKGKVQQPAAVALEEPKAHEQAENLRRHIQKELPAYLVLITELEKQIKDCEAELAKIPTPANYDEKKPEPKYGRLFLEKKFELEITKRIYLEAVTKVANARAGVRELMARNESDKVKAGVIVPATEQDLKVLVK